MTNFETLLGDEAETLLHHECKTIPKDGLALPGPDFVDRVVALSDRRPRTSAQPANSFQSWPTCRYRLPFYFARGSRRGTFRRSLIRT